MKILRGGPPKKFLDTGKGGSEKIVGLGGGAKNLYTSKQTGARGAA